MIQRISDFSVERQESFLECFVNKLGFASVAIIPVVKEEGSTAVGFIEIGVMSYQFLIKFVVSNTIISEKTLFRLRSEANPLTNKGLIITTSSFTREAKKAKKAKGEIPIDLVDGSLLVNKINTLKFYL